MTAKRMFHVLPGNPSRLQVDMSTTIVEAGNNISTHLIQLYDAHDNITAGQPYNVTISINGGGVVFDQNSDSELSLQISE